MPGNALHFVPFAKALRIGHAMAFGCEFDTKSKTRKVLCFLRSFYEREVGYTPDGCFCSVLDPKGDKLYVSWDGWRKGQPNGWESCALTVIHIPESER